MIEVWSSKPIPEITDVIAGRMWTHDNVQEVSALLIDSPVAYQILKAQLEHEREAANG